MVPTTMKKPFNNPFPSQAMIDDTFERYTDDIHRSVNDPEHCFMYGVVPPAQGGEHQFNLGLRKEFHSLHTILCLIEWVEAQLTEQGKHPLSALTRISPQDLALLNEYMVAIQARINRLIVLINTVLNDRQVGAEGSNSLTGAINSLSAYAEDSERFVELEARANKLMEVYAQDAAKSFSYSNYVWSKPHDFARKAKSGVGGNPWTMRNRYGRE